ncbi:MAG TPA: IS5 family transposase [Sphingobacterium sp.]|nr:IS5 family transposase [Sphingobacterium sp.]
MEKILENEQGKRKRKHDLRTIVNSILWITRTGVQWRNLDSRYPYWQIVYYYFHKWQRTGTLKELLSRLVVAERQRQGRNPRASRGAVDSQSVKKVSFVHLDTGIDGGKLINGRKRHLAVDSLGLPLAIAVTSAQVYDGQGGFELLWQIEESSDSVRLICADQTYRGEFSGVVQEIYKWKIEISQKPESKQGFVPQKGRWQVERSFSWLNFYRRLAKDYEKTVQASLAFIQVAFCSIILARNPSLEI